ncbi:UPF0738 family protein [Niallia endozanthoxylica]|uniref:UPF0738 protein F4V44_06125 n=1 Tax=Niallia endozanthoxylica TaxID=2036016 RepID=A0A5J5HYI3_9BACI|nr:hypothetical protein [Niallia endozanthoxylica]KAA9027573.1 hypothetical protein F4V44_06125 [Niallia endozanthoxylica]
MTKRLTVTDVIIIPDKEVQFKLDSQDSLNDLKPSGQMLVDSEGLSFIYLLENEEAYTYISVPDTVWSSLKEVISNSLAVVVINGGERLLLPQFQEELEYLIDNIKGNSNYGEKMMNKVEAVFG